MAWKRYVMPEPPEAQQMEDWEAEGWSWIQVLGPCPGRPDDDPTAAPRALYVVYLHRSIIELAGGRQAVN